jgi:molybdate transport system substrate-binding protein
MKLSLPIQAALLLVLVSKSAALAADTVNVAVASNFASAMETIKTAFEAVSEHELRLIKGSSGKHYAQIRAGAPFDVFLSADQERPRRLVAEGFANKASVRSYAQGQLALWSRQEGLELDEKYLYKTELYETIAIANPRLAPYGEAARQVFENLAIESLLAGKIVMGENIAQTFQFVFSGNATLGLVAYSQTLSPQLRGLGSVYLLPAHLYQAILQDMVLLTETAASLEFVQFMASPELDEILHSSGYLLPGEAR